MKLPLNWLKEYVNFNVTTDEFVERMMWRGFEIAAVEPVLPEIEHVVVGHVLSVEDHPNANKLHVCSVDVGQENPLCIVCGASNVFAGAKVPVALSGATLPGGIKIAPTEMRGVMSYGMLCSGKELGLTNYPGGDVNGLLILTEDQPVGQTIQEAVGLDDVVFDIELTPNRADCQSIIGICREAAAALGQNFQEPIPTQVEGEGHAGDYASVTVLNPTLCPRYAARVVTDIKIEPSPLWMQRKLLSVGLRPINNIVDITNLVMVEYGHPMHAFDLRCVANGHIIVRNAYENETVVTLDSKPRAVTPDMLLIADPEKGVGIAGVMGGENSEITDQTKAVLFESAVFLNSNIRATSRKLRLTTDAAARFIRGVEAVNAKKALDRAIALVKELGAGKVVGDTIDVCNTSLEPREIAVDAAHINRLLNLNLSAGQMIAMLDSINIPAVELNGKLVIQVPHYRVDIESGLEADWDIAEEIARIYGYYNIEPTLMRGDTFLGRLSSDFSFEDALKDQMVAMGCYEMYNYNFMGPKDNDKLLLPMDSEKRQNVKILNPFGEDQSLMRTTLYVGMLRTAALNRNRRTNQGRFFEVGNAHFDNNDILPEERKLVGMLYMGEEEDFYTLKGSIEELLESLGVNDYRFAAGGGEYLQPGRCAQVFIGDDCIGEMGEVHPDVARAFDVDCRAYVAELVFSKLLTHRIRERTYEPLPRYPVVQRDLAVLVDEGVQADTLKHAIQNAPVDALVEHVNLFDVYRGGTVPQGQKSMAYSFTLRANDRTLNDADIKAAMDGIINALKQVGAVLRT